MKKILALVLATVLAVSMLAGCGGDKTNVANENEDVLKLEGVLCSAEPLELTIHMHFWQTNVFDPEWKAFAEAAKRTNITLKGTAPSTSTESEQLFSTMLATEPLPDIIHGSGKDLNQAGMDGALLPLDDLIKKYAPNIQAALDADPDMRAAAVAPDGNLYFIPYMIGEPAPAMGFFIRQDWLDKLGLKQPTTVQEYHDVLLAFKTQDPNGNGKADEVPYFDRHNDLTKLIALWGLPYNSSIRHIPVIFNEDNGTVSLRATDEKYKTAVKELAKWYAEGIIDQEIFTRQNAREELLGANLGGATADWFSSTSSFNDKLADAIPGINLIAMPPVADTEGVVRNPYVRATSGINALSWGISADNKYPAETMKYFDFWFTNEGYILSSYGIEGEDFTYDENGVPHYTEEVLAYQGGAPEYVRYVLGGVEFGKYSSLDPEIDGMNEAAKAGFKMYVDGGYTDAPEPALGFTDEEQKVITEVGTALDTLIAEKLQIWIMGQENVDDTWDKYVSDLEALGSQEYIDAYQSAYARYLEAK